MLLILEGFLAGVIYRSTTLIFESRYHNSHPYLHGIVVILAITLVIVFGYGCERYFGPSQTSAKFFPSAIAAIGGVIVIEIGARLCRRRLNKDK
ncbi:MAG TPA: hypothetical protein VHV83_12705 [Armatimonadota bacterium]|nr:hypothetical protein [Armatimonadota bacterium]